MTVFAKLRELFRPSEETRRRRAEIRLAEQDILDRKARLQAAAMGVPDPGPDDDEDQARP